VITARIPVRDGIPCCEGDCTIAGVPDPGAAIRLDFGDCSGAVSGKLLPTGTSCNMIEVEGRSIPVSLVDAATPFVFVRASDIGATGTETPEALKGNQEVMARLEQVRGWAAVALGLVASADQAQARSPNIPRVIMVAPPTSYATVGGGAVAEADIDICVRQLAMQRPHKALAVTGAVCTAVACAVPGSIISEMIGRPLSQVRLGHPSGMLRVASTTSRTDSGDVVVESAQIERTARLVMDGTLFVRRCKIEQLQNTLLGAKP
jgi:2-methylaconitate cis-trans-isomerase PrpF